MLPEFGDELVKTVVAQEFGRVRGHLAYRNQIQLVAAELVYYQVLPLVSLAGKVVHHARLGLVCQCGEGALAQVKVHYDGLAAVDGQCRGEVAGDEGLTCTHVETCHHEDFLVALLALEEFEVGTNHAEGLVHHVAGMGLDHNLAVLRLVRYLEFCEALESFAAIGGGKFAQERQGKVLKVFVGLCVVQLLTHLRAQCGGGTSFGQIVLHLQVTGGTLVAAVTLERGKEIGFSAGVALGQPYLIG